MENHDLIVQALKAKHHAYVPYSGFPVGSAMLGDNGRVYTGCNIENASYGLSNCAERTAIFKAISDGVKRLTSIAIVADTKAPISPCGACRQVMVEFFDPQSNVILTNKEGEFEITTVANLLPNAFNQEDLT